jgi:hypothetical protein
MSKLPTTKVPLDHELLVMSRVADLYATLHIEARHRVHHYIGERIETLPTLAAVGPAPTPAPPLPFHRSEDDAA